MEETLKENFLQKLRFKFDFKDRNFNGQVLKYVQQKARVLGSRTRVCVVFHTEQHAELLA